MKDLLDPIVTEVRPGVHRLGTGHTAFYLLEEGGRYTLVDDAFPRYYRHLESFLAGRGKDIDAIEAQVLTHHHDDHRGMTERIRTETGGPVWIHHVDQPQLTGRQSPPKVPIWRPKVFRAFAHMIRNGIVRTPPVLDVSTFDDGEVIDVPGRPKAILVPGHTGGNCAFDLGQETVITGDALITIDIFTWEVRPSIPASFFNDDSELAIESLARLETIDAQHLLPGHGPVWQGPIDEAVEMARRVGVY